MADIVFDEAALRELFEGEDGPIWRELARRTIRVETAAKRLAPVDTGRLRSSITHAMGREGGEMVGRVGTNVKYAPYVELGTSRTRAQPFLRPALDAAGTRWSNQFGSGVAGVTIVSPP